MSVMDALVTAWEANPEATESMIDDIVLDMLADEGLDNADVLNKAAAAYVGQRVAVAKRALLRQYASDVSVGHYPDDEVHKAARWLSGLEAYAVEVISKDDGSSNPWTPQQERQHKRDARGRFTRGVNQNKKVNPLQYASTQQMAKPLRANAKINPQTNRMELGIPEERAKEIQGQYEQADEILREFGAAFGRDERKNINALIQYQEQSTGAVKTLEMKLSDAAHGMPDDAYGANGIGDDDNILAIEIDAGHSANDELAEKVRRFNTMGAMGGAQMAALTTLPKEKRTEMTRALMPRGPEEKRLTRLFSRFTAGADVLEHHGQDKLAGMARFMGEYGPEAEKVLDPRVRQAAYRYRGTEKEPDIELMRHMNSPQMTQVEAVARGGSHGHLADQVAEGTSRIGATPPVEGSVRHNIKTARQQGEQLTEDQVNMRVRSDVAAMHLMKTIPMDRMVAELSQKAGNILPSQGVLIDADGDVVSQSVGFGDDTYLPFDYNNMKRSMRGGQYVRTRVQGGLTGEDIAAAVGNGARMATVVSSSGVHSIEFDPNLRGGRANSDKARSMYRRYIQILDAVENSGLYTQDIDPREKARLRSRAAEITGAHEGKEFDAALKTLTDKARAQASSLSEEEMDGLMDQATKQVNSEPRLAALPPERKKRMIDDAYGELEQKASAEKASKLRLNAEGYQVALQTLQQQFPYFIRSVNYEPLAGKDGEPGFLNSRGQAPVSGALRQRLKATDTGYMRPGGLRAASVESGFYRTDQGMAPKRKTEPSETPEAPAGGPGGAAPGTPGAPETPAAAAMGAAPGTMQGGLSERARYLKPATDEEKRQALTKIADIFGPLAAGRVTQEGSIGRKTWDQVSGQNNANVAGWLFMQEDPGAHLNDPEKAGRLAAALADRESVKRAFGIAFNEGNGPDFYAGGVNFDGRSTPDEAAEYVADLAMSVVDADLVAEPFVAVRPGKEALWHTGTRPQAVPVGGVDVNTLLTPEQLKAVTQNNAPIAALAHELGTNPDGNFKPAAAVGNDISERIQVLQAIPKIAHAIKNDPGVQAGNDMPASLFVNRNLPPGMSPEKFNAAFARMYNVDPNETANWTALTEADKPSPEKQAKDLQEAWALIGAGRGIAMTTGRGRVGGPKAPGQAQGLIWKADPPRVGYTRLAWPQPRLERVSKGDSPLAREISRRRLAGLAFIPTRT